MFGCINAMNEAMSPSVSDRPTSPATFFSCSGVGIVTDIASPPLSGEEVVQVARSSLQDPRKGDGHDHRSKQGIREANLANAARRQHGGSARQLFRRRELVDKRQARRRLGSEERQGGRPRVPERSDAG